MRKPHPNATNTRRPQLTSSSFQRGRAAAALATHARAMTAIAEKVRLAETMVAGVSRTRHSNPTRKKGGSAADVATCVPQSKAAGSSISNISQNKSRYSKISVEGSYKVLLRLQCCHASGRGCRCCSAKASQAAWWQLNMEDTAYSLQEGVSCHGLSEESIHSCSLEKRLVLLCHVGTARHNRHMACGGHDFLSSTPLFLLVTALNLSDRSVFHQSSSQPPPTQPKNHRVSV